MWSSCAHFEPQIVSVMSLALSSTQKSIPPQLEEMQDGGDWWRNHLLRTKLNELNSDLARMQLQLDQLGNASCAAKSTYPARTSRLISNIETLRNRITRVEISQNPYSA